LRSKYPPGRGHKNGFKRCPAYTFFVSTGLAAANFDFFEKLGALKYSKKGERRG